MTIGQARRVVAVVALLTATSGRVFTQQAAEPSFDDLAELANRLVVMVSRDVNEPAGAGIVFGRRGNSLFVATANHVVRRPEPVSNLTVTFRVRPSAPVAATLLPQVDRQADLAVMEVMVAATGIDPCELPFDRLGPSSDIKRGSAVYALGNPNGIPWGMPLQPEFVAQRTGDGIAFQSSFISAGHSGGALLDNRARLVALIRADQPPLGLATDLQTVLATMAQWGFPVQLRPALPLDRAPLHVAAERGDVAQIAKLLADCGRVNAKSTHDETPLHFAASGGHVEAIDLLVKAGAALDAIDGDGDTPLHWAVQKGQVAALTRLLQAGAAASVVNIRRLTPLHEAVAQRIFGTDELPLATRIAMVRALLAGRAATNREARWLADDSPLNRAVLEKDQEIARILIAAGAKPIPDDLTTAVGQHDVAITAMLIAAGADLNANGRYNVQPGDNGTDTPLNLAARLGHLDTVRMLVEAGADVNRQGFLEFSPLAHAMKEKRADVEAYLLARGAHAKTGLTSTTETLLWEAVEGKRAEAVKRLIADGVDVNGTQGRALIKTLLWVALESRDAAIVQMVVEAGADVNKWVLAEAPLLLAVRSGNPAIVASLLRAKANPSEGGAVSSTPLGLAIDAGSLEIVRLLVDAGAEVRPAHVARAVELRREDIAALLRPRVSR